MSDGGSRNADGVFSGLDAFDDNPIDSDAMDRMLLTLADPSEPPDWNLESLSSDFPSSSLTHLSLQYIDAFPTTIAPPPTPALANPNAQLPNPSPFTSAAAPSHPDIPTALDASQDSPPALNSLPEVLPLSPSPSKPAVVPQLDSNLTTTASPRTPSISDIKPPTTRHLPLKRPSPSPLSPSPPSIKRPPAKRPACSPNIAHTANNSASNKTRVPTARCSLCSRDIPTNSANFRRHQQACRRQHSKAAATISSLVPNSPSNDGNLFKSPSVSPVVPPANGVSVQAARSLNPSSSTSGLREDPLGRRDSDLLSVVHRLEESISSLDVNARLCLRDALVSLSNKASNPTVQPTPQQEAMNRAAEYLVLRMLFLSGQQVIHTPPGTGGGGGGGGAYPETPVGTASSPSASAIDSPQTQPPRGTPGSGVTTDNDGTVAASTGNVNVSVVQPDGVASMLHLTGNDNVIDMHNNDTDDKRVGT